MLKENTFTTLQPKFKSFFHSFQLDVVREEKDVKKEKADEKVRPETAPEEDSEKPKKRKHKDKKHKKHKKQDKEKSEMTDEQLMKETSFDDAVPVEQPTPLFERKINNVNYGFNIKPEEKPEPKYKMIYPGDESPAVKRKEKSDTTTTRYYQDDSGTDNQKPTQTIPRNRKSFEHVNQQVWSGHKMSQMVRDYSEDDLYSMRANQSPGRVLGRFESDVTESDEGPRSPRLSLQQLKKKKKKKRSRSRFDSDSD